MLSSHLKFVTCPDFRFQAPLVTIDDRGGTKEILILDRSPLHLEQLPGYFGDTPPEIRRVYLLYALSSAFTVVGIMLPEAVGHLGRGRWPAEEFKDLGTELRLKC